MNDPCDILLRDELEEPAAGDQTLWVVDENLSPNLPRLLAARQHLLALTNRVDIQRQLAAAGISVELSDFDFSALPPCRRIVYRVSKERTLVHHCLNGAAALLPDDGGLVLIGEKQDGLKTHARRARDRLGGESAVKKEGRCYRATITRGTQAGTALDDNDYHQLRPVEVGAWRFYSKPGIFGWNKLDRGSELLVESLRAEPAGHRPVNSLLDLGCGWGYLTLATADLPAERRVATDNNVAAVAATRRNAAEAGLPVECLADDCASQIRERFDLILCNPPFHRGFATSEALGRQFLGAAKRLLKPGGRAYFVVNQFIPLDRLAGEFFEEFELLQQREGFKVFRLHRPS